MNGTVKTGVLTFHRCINYGSYWQAKCLADGLRSLGHDAVILDHDSRRVNLAEWKCALRPTLPVPVPAADRSLYRRKMRRFFRAFDTLPLSTRFLLEQPAHMPECDIVVVGSDEVWNLSHPWYGGCPLFYGEGVRAQRLVSYAASFGHYDAAHGLDGAWSRRLRSFQRIAVRDAVSRSLVEDAVGRPAETVLDPCLAFPPSLPADAIQEELPYVAVYGHGFSPAFADAVLRWARRRRIEVVSIGYRNDWADRQWIDAGPDEFAAFIAGARAVATNFFHGCVFALRFQRPFACEGSWYRNAKLRCLTQDVGAQRHLVDAARIPAEEFEDLLDEPLPASIQLRIEALRARSRDYLQDALAAA